MIGELVEITAGNWIHMGKEGVVQAVEGTTATVLPIDTNSMQPIGEPFEIHVGALTVQPSQSEIRKAKVKFRAEHIANLPDWRGARPNNIREYVIGGPRRRAGKLEMGS